VPRSRPLVGPARREHLAIGVFARDLTGSLGPPSRIVDVFATLLLAVPDYNFDARVTQVQCLARPWFP